MTKEEAIKIAEPYMDELFGVLAEDLAKELIDKIYDSIYRAGYDDGHAAGIEELMGMHKEHD